MCSLSFNFRQRLEYLSDLSNLPKLSIKRLKFMQSLVNIS